VLRSKTPAVTDLLSPIAFKNGASAHNRVALAAMTNLQSHADGSLSDAELHWLDCRAEGGFGIVTTCASHVARDGQAWAGELGIFDDSLLPGLEKLASTLHAHGAFSLVQLFHGGLRADAALIGERPWSANDVADGPRAATEADLTRVIRQFAEAAVRAHKAGFDGVELHGAHGYLLGQFLSSIDNTRTDGWGGSIENRARLIREVTRAVRASVPASFVVGVRISPEDFGQARGLDLDESLQVAKWLVEDGIDFLHLSLWKSQNNTAKRPEQHALQEFRAVVPADVRLFVAGNLWTRADADQMVALGADIVALGRSGIANPDWPTRIADPSWEPKRPPLSAAELVDRGLSPGFVEYMRRWKGFVSP
jgi:2,4-dienoyl-CoA reductase-like NADH-dependent reductase (Old Yellow Enzyme family)